MDQELSLLQGALRVFDDFSESNSDITFTYNYRDKGFELLKEKYPIQQAAGNGSEPEKALNLLRWCSSNVFHNGEKDVDFIPKTSVDILNYAFQKGKEYGVYCRLQAIVFTECCLALGMKARILHCLPYSPYDMESHVVSIVYIKEWKKWVMLDPGKNGYFLDEADMILSPLEVRQRLGNHSFIKCSVPDAAYKAYMTKNLFYFKAFTNNTYGSDLQKDQKTVYCIPRGFQVLERERAYCEFGVENSPEAFVQGWKIALEESEKRKDIILLDADAFFERKSEQ